ncbi:hemolymph lipopolysaccharide-binding protein-like [Cydia pomonella]|uniref:hemolymph lipopolysaccharide-binding protein-like n=1 Tax=Cydia pomonella TaxID=82600 RepID=UPI002ADE86FA|nr:hemolymph lipopolysaccharide-binding protein-like [Cydia pomonella]XP_061707739.1 hemolymph lipopolysaccharide-binding protein-like [Cydia pomonella]
MVAMMAEKQLTYSFTGINSIRAKDNFTSLDGVRLSSIPLSWAADQPDNANSDEDCVALTGAGKMADVSCASMLPYFCRKENKCGPKDNGYDWQPRTSSCYKFHHMTNTWRKALATCHAEGGHLAIINSDTESTVLKELYEVHPDEVLVGASEYKHAFIGFRKYEDNEWATIYGEPLAEAGFTVWNKNEPSKTGYRGLELCGSIHRNGLLNDAPCEDTSAFICEITP